MTKKRILLALAPLVLAGSIWGGIAYAHSHRYVQMDCAVPNAGFPNGTSYHSVGSDPTHAPGEICTPVDE